ncbi:MAG: hypothetical protein LBK82_04155 [Planctomycetaceae bacterium]|jgi:tetratricopeptide (TPR) repeat protein|nr:hypothetical protein [Planctomycetaceae bacterium]
MLHNIYTELELFLDPPITAAGALEADLQTRITNWNKMINANPTYKVKVRLATEWIKSGLSKYNLQQQANDARKQKLQELDEQIKHYELVGGIEEDDIKDLVRKFKETFTKSTVCNAAEKKDTVTTTAAPTFTPPKQPESLNGKTIAFVDMKRITEDLKQVHGGKKQTLYDLLELPKVATVTKLSEKAKELADKALKMPKSNSEADPLGRLSGKCLSYFKDETNKQNYDLALKRFTFEQLAEKKFFIFAKKFVKKQETLWDIYQQSVQDTVEAGYSQVEAEWLVYEYFFVTRKCPLPIPTPSTRSGSFKPIIDVGKIVKYLSDFFTTTTNTLKTLKSAALRIGQELHNVSNLPTSAIAREQDKELQKNFNIIKQEFARQKEIPEIKLKILFEQLDGMSFNPAHLENDILALRSQIAEQLGDIAYRNQILDLALQCCEAVLEYNSNNSKYGIRKSLIIKKKDELFQQLHTFSDPNDVSACLPLLSELKTKFPTDAESQDFCKKIENKIQSTPLPDKQVLQKLLDERRYFETIKILSPKEKTLEPSHQKALNYCRQKIKEIDNAATIIRNFLNRGNLDEARQKLNEIVMKVADHPVLDNLREELRGNEKIITELKIHFDDKRWIKAENCLRRYLFKNPVLRRDLAPAVDIIEQMKSKPTWMGFAIFITVVLVLFYTVTFLLNMAREYKYNGEDWAAVENIVIIAKWVHIAWIPPLLYFIYRLIEFWFNPLRWERFVLRQYLKRQSSEFALKSLTETQWYQCSQSLPAPQIPTPTQQVRPQPQRPAQPPSPQSVKAVPVPPLQHRPD